MATSFTFVLSGMSRMSNTRSTVLSQSINSSGCNLPLNSGISNRIPRFRSRSGCRPAWLPCLRAKGF
ncbi:hypothetical protein HanRHA438_Chr14g0641431 [Helianthus annuus]|nr:hypothetical protein HanRHA438_Chr14g0641431 [Helianthus annuus]